MVKHRWDDPDNCECASCEKDRRPNVEALRVREAQRERHRRRLRQREMHQRLAPNPRTDEGNDGR